MHLPAEPCLITTERVGALVKAANAPDLSFCLAPVPPGGDIPAGHAEPPPLRREGEQRALREAPPTGCPELRHTVGADSIRPPCGSLSEALGLSRRPAAVTEGVRLLPSAVSREIDGRHLPQRGRLWASSRGAGSFVDEQSLERRAFLARRDVARNHDNGDLIRRFAPPSPCAGKA